MSAEADKMIELLASIDASLRKLCDKTGMEKPRAQSNDGKQPYRGNDPCYKCSSRTTCTVKCDRKYEFNKAVHKDFFYLPPSKPKEKGSA